MILQSEIIDLPTTLGPMRTYLYRPALSPAASPAAGRGRYPGIIFFSEIFQQTEPIKRAASYLAGHGYVVAVPEIFHELNPLGTVLPYDKLGTEKGNIDKVTKSISSYDEDARVVGAYLAGLECCSGSLGAMGICIGGHLAFRAAMDPRIRAAACFYATDIHSGSLGKGKSDDSLARAADIKGELLMIWGRQDPHIPQEGRALIYESLSRAKANFSWLEFNAQHAFIRDEGHRYDPELTTLCWGAVLRLFARQLASDPGERVPGESPNAPPLSSCC